MISIPYDPIRSDLIVAFIPDVSRSAPTTDEGAARRVTCSGKKILTNLKQAREVMPMIVESVTIARDVDAVYRAFADLHNWKRVLPDVLDVKVLYDDGYQQEFLMTVERPAGPETVRGIRFLKPGKQIELFQPNPPPAFKRMNGVWKFIAHNGSTVVESTRIFDLIAQDNDSERTLRMKAESGEKLREYLRKNLEIFKRDLEAKK